VSTDIASVLIAEGCRLAGKSEYETLALGWLNRWLDSVAMSWEWPQLREELVGYRLRTGVAPGTGYQFGLGTVAPTTDGPTERVTEIYDNVLIYLLDGSYEARLPLATFMRDNRDKVAFSNAVTGVPSRLLVEKPFQSNTANGQFLRLYTDRQVDREYLLNVPFKKIPAAVTAAQYPWFPDDETIVHAVKYKCLDMGAGNDDQRTLKAQQDLAGLLSAQRVRYASETINGDKLQLSRRVFRHRGH
jgi:hypothetical protein